MFKYSSAFVGLLAWAALSSSAHAHIKLIKPDAWLNEDESGGPQKGGPCGPGGFDDVQPVPMSMKVTTVTAGDMLMVEFEETIHHPGWFRIALAEDPADFEEIEFPNTANCNYDMSKVPTEPHGNVLADGLGMDSDITGPNRKFMEMVKLPDAPCEKCTLQVIQVMADALHSPPGCVYYHCAELKIVAKVGAAAGSGAAGSGGVAAAAGSGGAAAAGMGGAPAAGGGAGVVAPQAGKGGAVAPPSAVAGSKAPTGGTAAPVAGATSGGSSAAPPTSEGGCSVARPTAGSPFTLAATCLALAALWQARRKRA